MKYNQHPNVTRAATVVALLSAVACGGNKEAGNTNTTTHRATSTSPAPSQHSSSEAPAVTPSASTRQSSPSKETATSPASKFNLSTNLCTSEAVKEAVNKALGATETQCAPLPSDLSNQDVVIQDFHFVNPENRENDASLDLWRFIGESSTKDQFVSSTAQFPVKETINGEACYYLATPIAATMCLVNDKNGVVSVSLPTGASGQEDGASVMNAVLEAARQ